MKVRMKATITGTRNGEKWPEVGGEIVLPDDEGADLCAQGLAEPVAEQPKPEKRAPAKKAPAAKPAAKKDA